MCVLACVYPASFIPAFLCVGLRVHVRVHPGFGSSACVCALVHVLMSVPRHDASVYLGPFQCVQSSWRDSSSTCYPPILPPFLPAPVIHLYIDLSSDKSGLPSVHVCVCVGVACLF